MFNLLTVKYSFDVVDKQIHHTYLMYPYIYLSHFMQRCTFTVNIIFPYSVPYKMQQIFINNTDMQVTK